MLMVCQTYTMSMLKNPSYSSSSACGVSQWNKVIQGCIPAHYSEIRKGTNQKKSLGWMANEVLPLYRSSLMRSL